MEANGGDRLKPVLHVT